MAFDTHAAVKTLTDPDGADEALRGGGGVAREAGGRIDANRRGARNATRRAFVAACRQAVDEGEALGDSELVHAAHNALNRIESNTTGPAAGTGAPWMRLCPVSGERIDSGNAFAGSDNAANAAAMVNGLLRPAGSALRWRAEAKLAAEWHNPAAAYQVATLCRERGLSTVGNKVRELFLEVQRLEDIHLPKTLPGVPGAGRE